MIKSVLMDYIDELTDIARRLDYIIGQYEIEDMDVCKESRKIESKMITHIASLQRQVLDD